MLIIVDDKMNEDDLLCVEIFMVDDKIYLVDRVIFDR
jgi:hypothetical protein